MKFDWERIFLKHSDRLRETGAANAEQHAHAFHTPRAGFESAIVGIFRGLGEYAAAHAKGYESNLSSDYVLGECWERATRAALGMLNGSAGRLDYGTLDGAIREIASLAGFEDSDSW